MTDIKILIATHKECPLPKDDIFLPIQVGKKIADKKMDIQGDDEGDNISEKNPNYCELTALYWAWKNQLNSDFIGLFHYRRYLSFESISMLKIISQNFKFIFYKITNVFFPGKNYILWPHNESSFENMNNSSLLKFNTKIHNKINEYEIFTMKEIYLSCKNIRSFWSETVSSLIISNLETIIQNEYPKIFNHFSKVLNNNRIIPCNMFIMKKTVFYEYSQFLFNTLEKLEISLIEKRITALPRTMGYIGEILTYTFIVFKMEQGIKVRKINMLQLSEL